MILSRRKAILGAGALVASATVPFMPAQAAGVTRQFDAYRGRKRFGGQAISLSENGSSLVVDLHIKLKGRVVVFNFDYEIRSREVWRDGILQSVSSTARENDKKFSVEAKRVAEGLNVKSSKFNGIAKGDITTSSIFLDDLATRKNWLSTQSGRVVKVTTKKRGPATVETPEGTVACNHYYCAGDLKLPVDAYFAETGELVSYEFDAVGARARIVARSVNPPFSAMWN